MKKILGLIAATFVLNACGSGGSGSTSDVQTGSVNIVNGSSTFNINSFTATGCRTIPANGTCTLQLSNYTGSNLFAGPLTLSTLNGYTSNIATQCNSANSLVANGCIITITNTSGSVSTAQSFGVIANGNLSSLPSPLLLTIGGGI